MLYKSVWKCNSLLAITVVFLAQVLTCAISHLCLTRVIADTGGHGAGAVSSSPAGCTGGIFQKIHCGGIGSGITTELSPGWMRRNTVHWGGTGLRVTSLPC